MRIVAERAARSERRRPEEGSAALELALVTPLVVLLIAGVLSTLGLVVAQLEVTQAARAAARTYAVTGDRGAAVTAAGGARGAEVSLDAGPHLVTVHVRGRGTLLGSKVELVATAAAAREPGS